MFRYILLAALAAALFLTTASTFATPATHAVPASGTSVASAPGPVVFDDGPGLGGGY